MARLEAFAPAIPGDEQTILFPYPVPLAKVLDGMTHADP